MRVNLNIEPHDEPQSLGVSCDDIIHVTDTRYTGKYHWRCSVVDRHTAKPLQTGTMPNYNRLAQSICKNGRILHRARANGDCSCLWTDALKSKAASSVCTIHPGRLALLRAQQLLLVRLQKMALEQKDFRKKVGGRLLLERVGVGVEGYCWTFFLSLQFLKKASARVRLVKAVDPSCRDTGSSQAVVYTLSKRKFLA